MVVLGTLIGGIVIAMYLPIFKLGQAVISGTPPAPMPGVTSSACNPFSMPAPPDAARWRLEYDRVARSRAHRRSCAPLGLAIGSLPERRDPPPAEDDGARVAGAVRRAAAESGTAPAPRRAPRVATTCSCPRSACPYCGHQITALENIPVLSWLVLRGKCSALQGADQRPLPDRRSCSPGSPSVTRAWHFGSGLAGLGRDGLARGALIALVGHRLRHPAPARLDHAAAALGSGSSSICAARSSPLETAVIGAVAGYLEPVVGVLGCSSSPPARRAWAIGDFKLLARDRRVARLEDAAVRDSRFVVGRRGRSASV